MRDMVISRINWFPTQFICAYCCLRIKKKIGFVVSEFASFLIGEMGKENKEDEEDKRKNILRKTLIERCNHISDVVRFSETSLSIRLSD